MKRKVFSFLTVFISFLAMIGGAKADTSSDISNGHSNPTNISSYTGINVQINQKIPKKYSFNLGKTKSDAVTIQGAVTVPDSLKTAWQDYLNTSPASPRNWFENSTPTLAAESNKSANKQNYIAKYYEVGVYNNKVIDVKASIVDYKPIDQSEWTSGTHANLTPVIKFTPGFIGVRTLGVDWVTVKYEFFEHGTMDSAQPKAIAVKGNTSYWDVDGYQGIILNDHTQSIYISSNDNQLKAYTATNSVPFIFDNSSDWVNSDKNYSFTETFNETTSLTRTYSLKFSNLERWLGDSVIYHSSTPVTPPETPDPTKKVSDSLNGTRTIDLDITSKVNNNDTYIYDITQEVPAAISAHYYKSFKFTDELKNVLTGTIKVYQDKIDDNHDKTAWFTTTNGQTVTATLTNPSMADFYGHTYHFVIFAKVKENLTESDLKAWMNGNVYKVPNTAKINITNYDNQTIERETNVVNVSWYGTTVKVPSTGAGIPLHVLITGLFILLSAGGSFGYMKYKKLI